MLSLFSLEGRCAVVTGGYGHLGLSLTRALAEAGATVFVAGRSRSKFESVFGAESSEIRWAQLDIRHTSSIRQGLARVAEFRPPDILVNNAFYAAGEGAELSDEEWSESLDGTLSSVYRCIREILPHMAGGSIVNVASMYGMVAPHLEIYRYHPEFFNPPAYGAAKAGVIQLTRYCAVWLGPRGIRVNCLSPGPFPSPEVQQSQAFCDRLKEHNPLGRIGSPDELKGAIVFLASAASAYVTGHNLVVDGGWTAW